MKIELDGFRKDAITIVKSERVKITVDGIDYKITKDNEGGIRINKFDLDQGMPITITPSVSNEIIVK
jgi:hypothetical protein